MTVQEMEKKTQEVHGAWWMSTEECDKGGPKTCSCCVGRTEDWTERKRCERRIAAVFVISATVSCEEPEPTMLARTATVNAALSEV